MSPTNIFSIFQLFSISPSTQIAVLNVNNINAWHITCQFFPLPMHSLPSPFSIYVSVRCELPTPADRCGSANHLHFHTHSLPSAGPLGDTARHTGCHQPLTQRWSCVWAAQPGVAGGHSSRWEVVQSRTRFLTDMRSSTRKVVQCGKVELS